MKQINYVSALEGTAVTALRDHIIIIIIIIIIVIARPNNGWLHW
jgi:hypothetical protein